MNLYRLSVVASIFSILAPGSANAQKIYWADNSGKKIQRANLDGSGIEDIVITTQNPGSLALSQFAGKIYWTEGATPSGTIRRANLDGTAVETLYSALLPGALAVDDLNHKLYWADGMDFGLKIRRADLDGQNVEDILDTDNASVAGIAVDPGAGKFYAIFTSVFHILRCNLDGSQPQVIVPYSQDETGVSIAVDPENQRIYWSSGELELRLFRANLDGSGITLLPFAQPQVGAIAIDLCRGKLYWCEGTGFTANTVKSARLDGSLLESFSPGASVSISGLSLYLPYQANGQEQVCVPATSTWDLAAMCSGLLVLGYLIVRRRNRSQCDLVLICVCATVSLTPTPSSAQDIVAEFEATSTALAINSGSLSAGGSGTEPVVLFSHELGIEGTAWIRLHFSDVVLAGDRASADGSYVRLTGPQEGAVQALDAIEMEHWAYSSAYFVGSSLLIELLAYPGTGPNQVTIDEAKYLEEPVGASVPGICGDQDDRVISRNHRVARLRYSEGPWPRCDSRVVCTAFLVQGLPNVLLSAGHCRPYILYFGCPFYPIVEFEAPPSIPDSGTAMAMPPLPEFQYAVDRHSLESLEASPDNNGQDWMVLGVYPNWRPGPDPDLIALVNPIRMQASSYSLASLVPATENGPLRVVGFGGDTELEKSWTEQVAAGAHVDTSGTIVEFLIDIGGGNSGSPLESACGEVYAIVTDQGCEGGGGVNLGTAIVHPSLVDALTPNIFDAGALEPKGAAADCNQNGILADFSPAFAVGGHSRVELFPLHHAAIGVGQAVPGAGRGLSCQPFVAPCLSCLPRLP